MEKIAIIIPAYNEEKRIGKTLKSYLDYFNSLKKSKTLDYEVIVAINATKDKTKEIVISFQANNNNLSYLDLKEGGKGYAIIEGFKEALNRKNDLIGFVDADMATSPEQFYLLIKNIRNYDGIIASRYVKGAKVIPPNTFRRLVVSRIFNFLVKIFFLMPYKDTQCGAKLFKRKAVEKILNSLTLSQWAFDVDILYNLRKTGFKIVEFPTEWIDKKYSTINFWKAGPLMLLAILRLRILNSPLPRIIEIYDKLPEKIKIHHKFK